MSVLDLFRPKHHEATGDVKPTEDAPVNASAEVTNTKETETVTAPQPAELGNTAVATAEIAGLITAPTETLAVEAPAASAEQPSDAEALTTVASAVNEPNETFTVPSTGQTIEPAPLSSQPEVPASDLQIEQPVLPPTYGESAEVASFAATESGIEDLEKQFPAEPTTIETSPVDTAAENVEEEDTFTSEGADETIANSELQAKGEN